MGIQILTKKRILVLMTTAAVPTGANGGALGGMVRHHWIVHFRVLSGSNSSRKSWMQSLRMRVGAPKRRINATMALYLYGGQPTCKIRRIEKKFRNQNNCSKDWILELSKEPNKINVANSHLNFSPFFFWSSFWFFLAFSIGVVFKL